MAGVSETCPEPCCCDHESACLPSPSVLLRSLSWGAAPWPAGHPAAVPGMTPALQLLARAHPSPGPVDGTAGGLRLLKPPWCDETFDVLSRSPSR